MLIPVQQVLMQFRDIRISDRKAGGLGVPAKSLEKLRARRLKSLDNIKILPAARRAPAGLGIAAEHKDRAARLLGELARDQPDDTLRPILLLAIDQDNLLISLLLSLLAHQPQGDKQVI